jgi:hypothetical protein
MRKKIIKPLAFAAFLLGIIYFIGPALLAPSADNQLATLLKAAGFVNISLPEPQKKSGALQYSNIALDKDSFSTIGRIKLKRSWSGGWNEIEIENVDLTGELHEGLQIALAGWDKNNISTKNLFLKSSPIISIKNARLSLLNEEIGGITLNFDLQIRPKGDDWEFQAGLKGAQSQLSYEASANGSITDQGFWQAAIDVPQTKFSLGLIKGSRVSGTINVSGYKLESSEILGELQAGGLSVLNLPWDDASVTLDGTLDKTRMILSAKSAGLEGIEFSLAIDSIQKAGSYSGVMHTDRLGTLFDFLNSRKSLYFTREDLAALDGQENLEANFKGSRNLFLFEINKDGVPLIAKGEIRPVDTGVSLGVLGDGLPFDLYLQNDSGEIKGTLALAQDGRSLVTLPEGKAVKPKLKENSELMDIFR